MVVERKNLNFVLALGASCMAHLLVAVFNRRYISYVNKL